MSVIRTKCPKQQNKNNQVEASYLSLEEFEFEKIK